MDPVSILMALVPLVIHGGKRLIDHFTGGPKPANAQEAIAMSNADLEKLKVLAQLDNADGAPTWVVAIRALQRPLAVFIILSTWGILAYKNGIAAEDLQRLASDAVFYLFGDRTAMYVFRGK